MTLRIGIVGDREPARLTHPATDAALAHAAEASGLAIHARWLATEELVTLPEVELAGFEGFFVAPGSPLRRLEGALRAIRHARESGVPLLGTCGGFQHVALELARGALGRADAQHAEYQPQAAELVIEPLACSLAGERGVVHFEPGSRVRASYGHDEAEEEYRCSYGLARRYRAPLAAAGLQVSGRDAHGEPRVVELDGHPFFLATLYVPQLRSRAGAPHPLFRAFVAACARGTA